MQASKVSSEEQYRLVMECRSRGMMECVEITGDKIEDVVMEQIEKLEENEKLFWPDFLRVISCFGVVLIHVTSIGMNDYDISTSIYFVSSMVNSIVRWAVPIFFMLSGMFLLDPSYELSARKLKKKILKLLLIIIVWGLFYSLLDDFSREILGVKSIPKAMLYVLRGVGGYHLWFLYTLLLIYLSLPILRLLTENASRKILKWAIVLWLVFSIGIGWVNDLGEIIPVVSLFKTEYSIEVITGYAGYFLLGYFLACSDITLSKRMIFAGFIFFAGILWAISVACIVIIGCEPDIVAEPTGVLTCLLAMAIFLLFKGTTCSSMLFNKAIHVAAADSLAIYLIHVFWITLIFRVFNVDYYMFGAVSIVIWLGGVLALSALTAKILRKLPLMKSVIVM